MEAAVAEGEKPKPTNGKHDNGDRDPPVGVYCRWCWCQMMRVYWTRRALGGKIQRCRICLHCGKKTYTTETAK
jgi:hypothetical protein